MPKHLDSQKLEGDGSAVHHETTFIAECGLLPGDGGDGGVEAAPVFACAVQLGGCSNKVQPILPSAASSPRGGCHSSHLPDALFEWSPRAILISWPYHTAAAESTYPFLLQRTVRHESPRAGQAFALRAETSSDNPMSHGTPAACVERIVIRRMSVRAQRGSRCQKETEQGVSVATTCHMAIALDPHPTRLL